MENTLTQDFILIINKWKKLIHKIQSRNKKTVFPAEFMMLNAIKQRIICIMEKNSDEPGVKISDLCEELHSTMPATSKMLKNLEDKGYIIRITDTKDRRVVYINLTESGTAIIKDAFIKLHDLSKKAILRLGEKDANELIRILNKFYDAMDTELFESDQNDINSSKENE